jgi:hypothetical protein
LRWEIKEYVWGGGLEREREILSGKPVGAATDPRASVQRAPAIAPSSAAASAAHPVAPISLLLLNRAVSPKLLRGRRSQSSLTPSQSLSPRSYVAESQYVPLPVAARISVSDSSLRCLSPSGCPPPFPTQDPSRALQSLPASASACLSSVPALATAPVTVAVRASVLFSDSDSQAASGCSSLADSWGGPEVQVLQGRQASQPGCKLAQDPNVVVAAGQRRVAPSQAVHLFPGDPAGQPAPRLPVLLIALVSVTRSLPARCATQTPQDLSPTPYNGPFSTPPPHPSPSAAVSVFVLIAGCVSLHPPALAPALIPAGNAPPIKPHQAARSQFLPIRSPGKKGGGAGRGGGLGAEAARRARA